MEFQIDYATSSFVILEASLGVLPHKGTASGFNLLILEETLYNSDEAVYVPYARHHNLLLIRNLS